MSFSCDHRNNRLEFPTVPVRVKLASSCQFAWQNRGRVGNTPRNGQAGKTLEILIINDKAIKHQNFKLAAPGGGGSFVAEVEWRGGIFVR